MADLVRVPKGRHALPFDQRYAVRESGCWEWQGHADRAGYGQFHGQSPRRVAWLKTRGPIPAGHVIYAEVCHNRACVNPDHMIAVTQQEMHDRMPVRGHPDNSGEMSPTAKVTADDVLFMRAQPMRRGLCVVLGRLFGLDSKYVWKLHRGDSWRHIGRGHKSLAMPLAQLRDLAAQRELERHPDRAAALEHAAQSRSAA